MNKVNAEQKAVCVLGMHRSGTSVVSRAINLMGAYLGKDDDLMSPFKDNPLGFWERDDIVDLQERLLARLGTRWDTALPLPDGWHLSDEVRPFREELIELISGNFSGHRLWAFKDPRTAILLPLWKDVLAELGVGMSCVFAVRNPLDVARSLEKRDGFPRDKSLGIWFNYNISALKALNGIPTYFISYDELLEDWEAELRRCSTGLGIEWPDDDASLRRGMSEFLRSDLRHSVTGLDALRMSGVPSPVVEFYEKLEEARKTSKQPADLLEEIKEISSEFSDYASLFRYGITANEKNNETLLSERDARREQLEKQLAHVETTLNNVEATLKNIYNSRGWKLLLKYYRLRNFLLPRGRREEG